MKKLLSIVTVCAFALLPIINASAFSVDKTLQQQMATFSGSQLNAKGELTLQKSSINLDNLAVSPDLANDQTVYVTTAEGLFRNSSFDPAFYQDDLWASDIKKMPFKAVFGSKYGTYGNILLYNGNSAYISFDKGNNFSPVTLAADGQVLKAALGPNFAVNQLVYFITASGLYVQNPSLSTSSPVLANDSAGAVTDFAYAPATSADNFYYVVKGTKVLKTENLGSSWLEHDTGNTVHQLVIADNGSDSGDVLVLSGLKKLEKSESSFSFYALNTPAGISKIYAVNYVVNGDQDYVISTDKGVYITYNNGDNWDKISYTISDYSKVKSLYAVDQNGQRSIYFILDDVLYRDLDASGTMLPYVDGITATAKYAASGSAVSKDIVVLSGDTFDPTYNISTATLWADGDLNSQTMNFFMTVDGTNWEPATANVEHQFTHAGGALKWKVEMATTNSAVTPVLRTVMVDFGFDNVPPTTCVGFSDVPATDARCAAITYVKNQAIFSGYPDGTFKPDQAINRAETVKVITKGFGLTILPDPADNLGFSDVILHEWYMPYLATAKDYDVIQGYPDGTFKPAQTVNYVELIKIFFVSAGVDLPTAQGSVAWYVPYVDYATNNGYLVYSQLDAGMKRGDVATLFYQHSLK